VLSHNLNSLLLCLHQAWERGERERERCAADADSSSHLSHSHSLTLYSVSPKSIKPCVSLFGFIGLKSKELQEPAGFSASALPIHLGGWYHWKKGPAAPWTNPLSREERECGDSHLPVHASNFPHPQTAAQNTHVKYWPRRTAKSKHGLRELFAVWRIFAIPGTHPKIKNKNKNQGQESKFRAKDGAPKIGGRTLAPELRTKRPSHARLLRRRRGESDNDRLHTFTLSNANRPTHLLHY
jgi:hypothetical protein